MTSQRGRGKFAGRGKFNHVGIQTKLADHGSKFTLEKRMIEYNYGVYLAVSMGNKRNKANTHMSRGKYKKKNSAIQKIASR